MLARMLIKQKWHQYQFCYSETLIRHSIIKKNDEIFNFLLLITINYKITTSLDELIISNNGVNFENVAFHSCYGRYFYLE